MFKIKNIIIFFILLTNIYASQARDYVHVVGSSSLYQFMTIVAEDFAKKNGKKTALIESTGTGNGIRLFCQGNGDRYPDLVGASRLMTEEEKSFCKQNLVDDLVELKFGYDGIVIATAFSNPISEISSEQLFLSLVEKTPDSSLRALEENRYNRWSDFNPVFPNQFVQIYGPSASSGTREYFEQDFMMKVCDKFNLYDLKSENNKETKKALCSSFRTDGRYIEVGDNYNVIIQKIQIGGGSLGLIPYSYYLQNQFQIKPILLDGIEPNLENIYSGKYELARPLYVYVKKKHFGIINGLKEFVEYFSSPGIIGEGGELEKYGLIPISN